MERADFERLVTRTLAEALARLEEQPDDLRALLWAELLVPHAPGAVGTEEARRSLARRRWAEELARLGPDGVDAALRSAGAAALLVRLWEILCEAHHSGPLLESLAGWLGRLVEGPDELARLAFVPDSFQASWLDAPAHLAHAAEHLAAAALERDPEHEEALYLYAQEDFLSAVNQGRKPGQRLQGPPVPERPAARWVAKVQQIVFAFEAGEHPLDLVCRLETVPVKTDEVVDALLRGLQCREWRGQMACCEALGRARLGYERIVPALCDRLRHGAESVPGHAAEALRELGKRKPAQVAALAVPSLEEVITRKPSFDVWEQHEIADALLALAPHAPAATRSSAAVCLRILCDRTRALGPKKLEFYGYYEFLERADKVLARLSPGGRPKAKAKKKTKNAGMASSRGERTKTKATARRRNTKRPIARR